MPEKKLIKKIKLSDGGLYYLCDSDAREALQNYLPLTGGTVTGELDIQNICKTNSLYILQTEFIEYTPTNVLIQTDDGKIEKRSVDKLLGDIGGVTYDMDDVTGTLTLKIGK